MPTNRLPSFNDFSPIILKGDLRPCLQAIIDGGGNDKKVVHSWAAMYFAGKKQTLFDERAGYFEINWTDYGGPAVSSFQCW